jgi:YidC/Oxa1 family membrane protein insertase
MFLEIVRILVYFPLLNLFTLFNAIPGRYAALSIVFVTLITRLILIVPSKRAAQQQRKISQLQPLLNELKTEYADDKQGLATAQMELYKKNNINPFGSCLPTVLQFIVLIALYQVIKAGLSHQVDGIYAWIPKVGDANPMFFGIDLLHPDKYFLLPVLAAALQYYLMVLTIPATPKLKPGEEPDPMMASQQMMKYVVPAATLFAARNFPAGVALYWVITTIFSIVQQRSVNKEKFNLSGVDAALHEADVKHPEHKKPSPKVIEKIKEETSVAKGGVSVTVRKKK